MNNSYLWESIKTLASNAGTAIDSGLSSVYQTFQDALSGINTIADAVANTGAGAVGLSYEGLDKLRSDIQTTVADLSSKIEKIAADADPSSAFKGEYLTAIQSYITVVKDVCNAVNSQLLYFSDRLAVIQANISTRQETMTTQINTDAQTVSDESIEEYTTKY